MASALADFIGGYQFGNQAMEQQRGQRQRSQLADLAGGVISGDPQAYAHAAAIDPQTANAYQQSGDNIARKARGAAKFLQSALQSGNPQQIAAARNTIKPFMDTLKPGTSYPLDMDPNQEATGLQAFLAQTAYLDQATSGGNVQSTYVDANGNRVAIMRDGTTRILGDNNQSIRVMEQEGTTPYGVVTSGGRAGQVVPLGGGAQGQAPNQEVLLAQANQLAQQGVPSEQIDAWLQQQLSQPVSATQAGVGPVRTPTAAEKAAQTEAARQSVQMQYLPQELGLRTDAAIRQAGAESRIRTDANLNQARGEAQIKNEASRATTAQQNASAGNIWRVALGNLKKSLGGTETGPFVGRLPAMTTSQQIADGAVSQMAPVLKQLFRQAGEGTFTDRDQDLLIAMLPTRTDTPAAAAAKMDAVDAMVQAKLQVPGAAPAAAPSQAPSAAPAQPSGSSYSNLWN